MHFREVERSGSRLLHAKAEERRKPLLNVMRRPLWNIPAGTIAVIVDRSKEDGFEREEY
jgi:hypothetical protein